MSQYNYKIEEVHISDICVGDTIMHYGEMKTVCRNNISYSDFMGISLFGDSYRLGYLPVKKVIFLILTFNPYHNEKVYK